MPDKPLEQACDARVCIHTDQILDSCMDKDCVEDLPSSGFPAPVPSPIP